MNEIYAYYSIIRVRSPFHSLTYNVTGTNHTHIYPGDHPDIHISNFNRLIDRLGHDDTRLSLMVSI